MMKTSNRLGLAVACATALVGIAAIASAVAADGAQTAGDCFGPAFKAGDADAVAACYAEDGVLWFPGGPMAQGPKAIRDGFAGFFAHMAISDIAMTEMGHQEMGDTRATWGTYAIRMTDKASGQEMTENGRYTDVQKKIGGRWLYVVDHPSDDPEPPMAPMPPSAPMPPPPPPPPPPAN